MRCISRCSGRYAPRRTTDVLVSTGLSASRYMRCHRRNRTFKDSTKYIHSSGLFLARLGNIPLLANVIE